MRNILDWDGEEWVGAIALAFLVFLLALVVTSACADKTPKRYYITGGSNNQTCVAAEQSWDTDSQVFCSDTPQKTLEVLTQANAALKGGK